MLNPILNRRQFLKFVGTALALTAIPIDLGQAGKATPFEVPTTNEVLEYIGKTAGDHDGWRVMELQVNFDYGYPIYAHAQGVWEEVDRTPGYPPQFTMTVERVTGEFREEREYVFGREAFEGWASFTSLEEQESQLLALMEDQWLKTSSASDGHGVLVGWRAG